MPARKIDAAYRAIAVAATLGLILLLTLTPNPGETADPAPFRVCVACGYAGLTDFLLNVILFAPLGAALWLWGLGFGVATLAGAVLSLGIELLQWHVVPGRFASPGDLVSNTAGLAIGWLIASRAGVLLHPERALARRLGRASVALWIATLGITTWLVRPSLPDDAWYGQWQPELGSFDRFTGEVTSARLGGRELPPHRLVDTPARRAALQNAPITIAGSGTTGRPTDRVAPIVSVFDAQERLVTLLGQRGSDLVYIPRTHAHDLRLRPPTLLVRQALAVDSGGPMHVVGTIRPGRLDAQSAAGGHAANGTLRLSPALGWSVLLPADLPLTRARADGLSFLWLLMLTAVVARLACQGWGGIGGGTVGGVLIVALATLSLASGAGWPSLAEAGGVVAGLGAGWASALSSGRRRPRHGA